MESSIHLDQNYHQEIHWSVTRTLRESTKIAPHHSSHRKLSHFPLLSHLINKKNSHFRRLQLALSKFHPTMQSTDFCTSLQYKHHLHRTVPRQPILEFFLSKVPCSMIELTESLVDVEKRHKKVHFPWIPLDTFLSSHNTRLTSNTKQPRKKFQFLHLGHVSKTDKLVSVLTVHEMFSQSLW